MVTALVADDSKMMVTVISRIVADAGCDVVATASTGTEALEKWRQTRPTIALLDVNMPGMTGVEVLERIRAEDSNSVVVIVTASRNADVADECKRLGANAFVTKNNLGVYLREIVPLLVPAVQE